MAVRTNARDAQRTEDLETLRGWIKPGDTVYTVLRNVSRSGMQREIGLVLIQDGVDLHPNFRAARVLGRRTGKQDGIICGGAGMDMGFEVVYNLSHVLYPEYRCTGERCQSSDHQGPNWPTRVPKDGTLTHRDDYALRQRWL